MQKVTPFLWFDNDAEEAVNFYVSVFKDGRIVSMSRYPEGSPMPAGTVMAATFEIAGQTFHALNGGPVYQFTPAISFLVDCQDQEEVDYYWEKLLEGGQESQCGWLTDRYGLSWQIVPVQLTQMLSDPDPQKAQRVMGAMLQMKKIDIAALEAAYDG